MKKLLDPLKLPQELRLENLDDPNNYAKIKAIIDRKPLLQRCYKNFYREIGQRLAPKANQVILELGSGCSNLQAYLPNLITSDVLPYPHVDKVFSALDIPYPDRSLDGIVMIDVFHHLPDCKVALREMERCLKPFGKIVMIEPAHTPWSRFIYENFHHEDFDVTGGWGVTTGGALTGANMAIPWIVFQRDRQEFIAEFPGLEITALKLHTPILYLVSGGLSLRQLVPNYLTFLVANLDQVLSNLAQYLCMFMTIELTKTTSSRN